MNPYSAYQQNAITHASREDILLKLLEGGILALKKARQNWQDGEHKQAREHRSRAMAIVTELDNTLDRENGPAEIVEELDALYGYMIRELNASALDDDFERLQGVLSVLESLCAGYQEAVSEYKEMVKQGALPGDLPPETAEKPAAEEHPPGR